MTLDTTRQPIPQTYIFFDYQGTPLVFEDAESYLDSLGRLILIWIAYGMPKELIPVIESYLYRGDKGLELRRHPGTWKKTSRDHWSYFIIYRALAGTEYGHSDEYFDTFCQEVKKMRGITTWKNALNHYKRAERRYYRLGIPGAKIGNYVLMSLSYLGGFGQEWNNESWIAAVLKYSKVNAGNYAQRTRTPWENFISKAILTIIPAFALHNKAWQIYVMPDSTKKARLQEILLRRVGKSNLVVRLLLNDQTITLREVRNYPDMSNYRPGVYLTKACRRDIFKLTKAQAAANNYEKQLVVMLWIKQAA